MSGSWFHRNVPEDAEEAYNEIANHKDDEGRRDRIPDTEHFTFYAIIELASEVRELRLFLERWATGKLKE